MFLMKVRGVLLMLASLLISMNEASIESLPELHYKIPGFGIIADVELRR